MFLFVHGPKSELQASYNDSDKELTLRETERRRRERQKEGDAFAVSCLKETTGTTAVFVGKW